MPSLKFIRKSQGRQGYDSALLIKGVEGGFSPALNKPIRRFLFDLTSTDHTDVEKEIVGLPDMLVHREAVQHNHQSDGEAARECLGLGLRVLAGEKNSARDSLLVTAAQIISAHNYADCFNAAVEKVQHSLDNGLAMERFKSLIESS